MIRKLSVVSLLLLATSISHAVQPSPDGDWLGEIRFDQEATAVSIHFTTSEGAMSGTAEMLGRKDLSIANGTLSASGLRFEILTDAAPFIFDGKQKDATISGMVLHGEKRGIFELIHTVPLDLKRLSDYVGTYELARDHVIGIFQTGSFGFTFEDFKTGETRKLWPQSETDFSAGPTLFGTVPVFVKVSFIKNIAGEVTGLMWQPAGPPASRAKRIRFRREETTFHNGDITLSGTLVLPNTKAPYPVLVRTHGSGPGLRNIPACEWLAYYGIASLTYDKRGSGKSTGDGQQANISDLADDAVAGVQLLKGREDIDARQIGLMGGSEGGWVVPLAASRSSDVAFAFIGSGSALSLGETIVYEVGMVGREHGFSNEEINGMKAVRSLYNDAVLTNQGWDVLRKALEDGKDKRWFRYARVPASLPATIPQAAVENVKRQLDFDPEQVWKQTRIPVLALWGGLDRNVPAQQSANRLEHYLTKAGNRDHELIVFPKGNHEGLEAETGFDEEYPHLKRYVPGYNDAVVTWMLKHVKVSR